MLMTQQTAGPFHLTLYSRCNKTITCSNTPDSSPEWCLWESHFLLMWSFEDEFHKKGSCTNSQADSKCSTWLRTSPSLSVYPPGKDPHLMFKGDSSRTGVKGFTSAQRGSQWLHSPIPILAVSSVMSHTNSVAGKIQLEWRGMKTSSWHYWTLPGNWRCQF